MEDPVVFTIFIPSPLDPDIYSSLVILDVSYLQRSLNPLPFWFPLLLLSSLLIASTTLYNPSVRRLAEASSGQSGRASLVFVNNLAVACKTLRLLPPAPGLEMAKTLNHPRMGRVTGVDRDGVDQYFRVPSAGLS